MFAARGSTVQDGTRESEHKQVEFEMYGATKTNLPIKCLVMNSTLNIGTRDVEDFLAVLPEPVHILLVGQSMSSPAKHLLTISGHEWEYLQFREVKFNILENVYVPTYTLLTKEQVVNVEKRFGSSDRFPEMIADVDPVARFMNFKVGDVLCAQENSSVSGQTVFFEKVVAQDAQL